jgi:hypothetical protein
MTEVPKTVCDRLQGLQRTAQAHPDAELLAGFAERALSPDERDGILEHLAVCGDCREVVTLALPAGAVSAPIGIETETDQSLGIPAKAGNGWIGSPALRWAALATGVAVAASVLLLHPKNLNQAMLTSEKQPATTIAQPSEHSQIAASTDGISNKAMPDEARPEPGQLPDKLNPRQASARSPRPSHGMLAANNARKPPAMGKLPTAPGTRAQAGYRAPANGSTSETFATSAESNLMAQNDAPAIEKAKQVPLAIQAQASTEQRASDAGAASDAPPLKSLDTAGLSLNPMSADQMSARAGAWSITEGRLQRSVDSGQSWQSALHTDRPLLCYAAHDEDVWAGGQAGILYHSSNGGLTWMQVRPWINSQQLSSDITHLELRDNLGNGKPRPPQEIIVSTSNNEIWTSIDGGTTWDKK